MGFSIPTFGVVIYWSIKVFQMVASRCPVVCNNP